MKNEQKEIVMEKLRNLQKVIQNSKLKIEGAKSQNDKNYYIMNRNEYLGKIRSVLDVVHDLGYTNVYEDYSKMLKEEFGI